MSSETLAATMPVVSGDIAKVLSSAGPVVKCVLLKAPVPVPPDNGNTTTTTTGSDATRISSSTTHDDHSSSKPPPTNGEESLSSTKDGNAKNNEDKDKDEEESKLSPRILLKGHMEEIEVDTTPSKSMVSQILGGPFTFLGQYEDEGIVLMIQKLPTDLDAEELPDLKLSELKDLCQEREIPIEQMLEKSDLIQALKEWSSRPVPPVNPHQLQPPLHKEQVRGDILVLKVAETKEELDGDDSKFVEQLEVPSNEEFFLSYSLDEYVQFASRTDIPEHEVPSEGEDDDGEGSVEEEEGDAANEESPHSPQAHADEDEEGVPLRLGDMEDIDEEDKAAMFNLVMNEVLRQYREENGRGPDTKELLEMRATIAKELDVQVAHIDADQADWNKNAKDGTPAKEIAKTIGFHTEDKILEYQPDPNEHNHHSEEYDEEGAEDENDYEGEPSDEADTLEPPSKRLKMDDAGDEMEQEDSKPAAVITDPVPEAASPKENGDDSSGDKR